ncbi:MAG: DUF3298 and DUF4163 domain-containing protein [Bacteroidota bacterium]
MDKNTVNNQPLQIISTTVQQTEGDCATKKCLEISLTYPTVKNASPALEKNINNWTHDFLIALLDPVLELDEETSLTTAIDGFKEFYHEQLADSTGRPGHFTVEVTDTVLLQNEKYLTLRMDAFSFTGGAHPNSTAAIATFNLETGKKLAPIDLVNDLEKLYAAAEKQFRVVKKSAFDHGFDFDESWPFVLPKNVGLTTEGLFFCYVPYEVAPYVMGFTEFVIPYEQLEKL